LYPLFRDVTAETAENTEEEKSFLCALRLNFLKKLRIYNNIQPLRAREFLEQRCLKKFEIIFSV
jgi:isocitrate/isopropylmalate dehydrogenase